MHGSSSRGGCRHLTRAVACIALPMFKTYELTQFQRRLQGGDAILIEVYRKLLDIGKQRTIFPSTSSLICVYRLSIPHERQTFCAGL
jgi:hypothetical protein